MSKHSLLPQTIVRSTKHEAHQEITKLIHKRSLNTVINTTGKSYINHQRKQETKIDDYFSAHNKVLLGHEFTLVYMWR